VIVQSARREDLEGIVELNRLFHLDMPDFIWDTPAYVAKHLDEYHVLRDASGRLAGAMCLLLEGDACVIETLAVRSQGRGIGSALVDFARAYAREHCARELTVESFCELGVSGFYERCGFTKDTELGIYGEKPYDRFSMNV